MKNLNDVSETTPPTLYPISEDQLARTPCQFPTDIPRAEMVHLPHTSVNLAAMVRSVRFELTACRAPGWTPILLADKDILCVEALKTSRVQLERPSPSMVIHPSLQVRLRLASFFSIASFSQPARSATAFAARALRFLSRLSLDALRAERKISRTP